MILALVEFPSIDQGALVQAASHDHLDDLVRTLIRRAGAAATIRTIALPAGADAPAPLETLIPLGMLTAAVADALGRR